MDELGGMLLLSLPSVTELVWLIALVSTHDQ